MDTIVFDIETKNNPSGSTGWRTELLGVGVAVVYEVQRDRFLFYGENQTEQLRSRLRDADVVAGFNIWGFDFPVAFGLSKDSFFVELGRQIARDTLIFDAYRLVRLGLGAAADGPGPRGLTMDSIAQLTLGKQAQGGKKEDSAKLPDYLAAGEIMRVVEECQRHVTLELDLCRFMLRHGYALTAVTDITYDGRSKFVEDSALWNPDNSDDRLPVEFLPAAFKV